MSKDFAVIKINSKQYAVHKEDRLKVDRISEDSDISVLVADVDGKIHLGEPVLSDMGVKVIIEEDKADKKISVRRYKSKSRYRKNKGHRQPVSFIKIADFGQDVKTSVTLEVKDSSSAVKSEKIEKKTVKSEKSDVVASNSIESLDITDRMKESLVAEGYKTVEDIKKVSKEELMAIKGFGEKAVDKLLDQVK